MINPKTYNHFGLLFSHDKSDKFFICNDGPNRYIGYVRYNYRYDWYIINFDDGRRSYFYNNNKANKESLVEFLTKNHREELEYLLFHPEWF